MPNRPIFRWRGEDDDASRLVQVALDADARHEPDSGSVIDVKTMVGTILLVQEGRFQLRDEQGASHLFLLGHASVAETDQLPPLARRQSRVRISYKEADNVVALIARKIVVLDDPQAA